MATNRKRVSRNPKLKVTPEAVELFKREEYLPLHRLLGLKPWEASPLDVDLDDDPPEVRHANAWSESWPRAMELRQELAAGLSPEEIPPARGGDKE